MAVCSSAAQIGGTVPVEHAFAHGEELEYAVSYKVSFVNTDVAGVTFRTTLGDYGGREADRRGAPAAAAGPIRSMRTAWCIRSTGGSSI